MAWHLEELGIVNRLSPRQHAFRKHHSTDTALSEVVNVIEGSVMRGGNTLGVFFDIQGAFDNARADKVIKGMCLKAVPEGIVNWYGYYLKNRNVSMSLGGKEVQRSITRGTPQGDTLTDDVEFLFDVLLRRLQGFSAVKLYGYADDGAVSPPAPVTSEPHLSNRTGQQNSNCCRRKGKGTSLPTHAFFLGRTFATTVGHMDIRNWTRFTGRLQSQNELPWSSA